MPSLSITPAVGGADPIRRQNDYFADLAVTTMTGPMSAGQLAPATQTIYGNGVHLYAGEIVTNIIVLVSTAGSGTAPTNLKLGLWDSGTPTCLAVTAELKDDARWLSTGFKVCALTAPFTIVTSGLYYPCWWINGTFASTNIQLMGTNSLGPVNNQIGSGKRPMCTLKTAAASMAANDTGTYAGGVLNLWFAVS